MISSNFQNDRFPTKFFFKHFSDTYIDFCLYTKYSALSIFIWNDLDDKLRLSRKISD